MIFRYDYFSRLENPVLTLCDVDDTEIGVITHYKSLKTAINFNDISEISYNVYFVDDIDAEEVDKNYNPLYGSIIERRQTYFDGVGYFVITSVVETEDESGKYKAVTAKSCEYELNNIAMPSISGTYQLYAAEHFVEGGYPVNSEPAALNGEETYLNKNCLLYEVLKVIPHWHLANQLETLHSNNTEYQELAQSFRTFESQDWTVYDFLKNVLQDTFGCFVSFDIENRAITILRQEDALEDLDFILSKSNILEKCEVTTKDENYVNAMYVQGAESVSIGSCNPLGGSMIYNFDHDIESGLISADSDLGRALIAWKEVVSSSQVLYRFFTKYGALLQATDDEIFGMDTITEGDTMFRGDGETTEFTVATKPAEVRIYVSGTLKTVTTDYTYEPSTGVILFTSAPDDNSFIEAVYEDEDGGKLTITYTGYIGDYIERLAPAVSLSGLDIPDLDGLLLDTTLSGSMSNANKNLIMVQKVYDSLVARLKMCLSTYGGLTAQLTAVKSTVANNATDTDNIDIHTSILETQIRDAERIIYILTGKTAASLDGIDIYEPDPDELTNGIIDQIYDIKLYNMDKIQEQVSDLSFENFFINLYKFGGLTIDYNGDVAPVVTPNTSNRNFAGVSLSTETNITPPILFDNLWFSGTATFTGDGVQKSFTVTAKHNTVSVRVNGVLKTLNTHYTYDVATGTITFSTAPSVSATVSINYSYNLISDDYNVIDQPLGDMRLVWYIRKYLNQGGQTSYVDIRLPLPQSVTKTQTFTANGSTQYFSITDRPLSVDRVTVDGVEYPHVASNTFSNPESGKYRYNISTAQVIFNSNIARNSIVSVTYTLTETSIYYIDLGNPGLNVSNIKRLKVYRPVLYNYNGIITVFLCYTFTSQYYDRTYGMTFPLSALAGGLPLLSDDPVGDGAALYKKFVRYIKQQTYTDEDIVITEAMGLDELFEQEQSLYNNATALLAKTSIPASEIGVTVGNFIGDEDFAALANRLKTGGVINAEMPNGEVYPYNLLQMNVDYDSYGVELTFGTRVNIYDPTAIFEEISSVANSAANIVASNYINWGIATENVNYLMQEKDASLDLTLRGIKNRNLSLNKDDVTIDSYGLRCMSKSFRDNDWSNDYGIWMSNGVLMFTDDGWNTPRTAIGRLYDSEGNIKYGFYGEAVITNTLSADKIVAGSVMKGTNLLRDGSFESADGLYYWSEQSPSAVCTIVKNDDNDNKTPITLLGNQYLSVATSSAAIDPALQYNSSISVDATADYTISFYAYLESGTSAKVTCGSLVCEATAGANNVNLGKWVRFSKTGIIGSASTTPTISIFSTDASAIAYIDGVMLEQTRFLNDFSPHTSEQYAKYTRIDDSGISVFGGKINIYNNNGTNVFCADTNGNLQITGKITATSGYIGSTDSGWNISSVGIEDNDGTHFFVRTPISKSIGGTTIDNISLRIGDNFYVQNTGAMFAQSGTIGGWNIATDGLYKDISSNGAGISTSNDAMFYAGSNYLNKATAPFRVSNTGSLRANDAFIKGEFRTSELIGSEIYNIRIKGGSIEFGKESNNTFSAGINFTNSGGSQWGWITGGTTTPDLAIAGSQKVIFGVRPNGTWQPVCEVSYGETLSIDQLYFRPATQGIATRSYLGDSNKKWSGIYVGGGLQSLVGGCFTPKTISYTSALGIPQIMTVLALDVVETIGGTTVQWKTLINLFGLDTISLNISSWNVGSDGGVTNVSLEANSDWTISSDSSWLTVSTANGEGNSSFNMIASQNSGSDARTGTITASSAHKSASITVTQAGTST